MSHNRREGTARRNTFTLPRRLLRLPLLSMMAKNPRMALAKPARDEGSGMGTE